VSVIIPVYQGEGCVADAIDSALNQTHEDIEILAIDDGSTDGTWPLLQSIRDSRVRAFSQENAGASTARNLGLTHATGEYIAFLDADDCWLPDKLEREIATLEGAQSQIGIAYSWWYSVDEDGMLFHRSPAPTYSGDVFDHLLNGSPFIIPSASLFHRAIFDDLGGFDVKRRYHEDFAFILRACHKYPAFPTSHYATIYKQTMSGKARRVLRDYDAALKASFSIVTDSRDLLSASQAARFLETQQRELYFRFLMYGFNESATRLLPQVPRLWPARTLKAWIGWLFAKTGVNLMMPGRKLVHAAYRIFYQYQWRRFLKEAGVTKHSAPRSAEMSTTLAS
jgi:glycosyltransferase involved in cell wall biosynthesis